MVPATWHGLDPKCRLVRTSLRVPRLPWEQDVSGATATLSRMEIPEELSELSILIAHELRKAGVPDSKPDHLGASDAGGFWLGAGGSWLGQGFDAPPHVAVGWTTSRDLENEARGAQSRLLYSSEHRDRPVQERLDALSATASPFGYRGRICQIMASAILEILLLAGFDAQMSMDDFDDPAVWTVLVLGRIEPTEPRNPA